MAEQMGQATRSPRERLARAWTLLRRGLKYWRGSLVVLLLAASAAVAGAWKVKHVYRSECTIFAKPRIRTDDRDESSTSPDQIARQGARLKDMLTTRGRLEGAIKAFGLYPETVANQTIFDAVEQMKPHVGFRALEGAQYVISFDGDDPDTVQKVTQYLSESLIANYASGDLDDLLQEADFLAQEEQRSLSGLEESTRALTLFLAAHPEFAVEAKQPAATPFGQSPVLGIQLMPMVPKGMATASDPELGVLYRERARLEGQARGGGAVARVGVPAPTSGKQLDDQIAQAQGEVEAAAKRVAETQADLASKSNLTEDHPDMRASRLAVDAAARQLHESKVKLAALQQIKESGSIGLPADLSRAPPEIADKLRQVDAHIQARRAYLRGADTSSSAGRDVKTTATSPGVAAIVELETDWQRYLRALAEAKEHHDDLKLRAERAKLAVEASRAQASERIAVVDPPFRPTHPSKGGRANVAVAGLAIACLLALSYATARVSLDDTLFDGDDVAALGLAPVLGVVPGARYVASAEEVPADGAA